MRPFKGFFLAWIIIELFVFILFVNWLGAFAAILLVILPMVFGGGIMQMQSMEVVRQAQQKMAHGESIEQEAMENLAVVTGGMLMLIPGIVTSIIGILLLIPGVRRNLLAWMFKQRIIRAGAARATGTVIEGEYTEEDK